MSDTFRDTGTQLLDVIREIRDHLDMLEHGIIIDQRTHERGINVAELVRRSRYPVADGYPQSVRGGPHGSGHGDPTGELAADKADAGSDHDPGRIAAATVRRGLIGARGDLRMAVGALQRAQPPQVVENVGLDEQAWCSHHLRYGLHTPARAPQKGRAASSIDVCDWCYRFRGIHNQLPDRELLVRHMEGRLTSRDVDGFLQRTSEAS